jgi:hypothetical protein
LPAIGAVLLGALWVLWAVGAAGPAAAGPRPTPPPLLSLESGGDILAAPGIAKRTLLVASGRPATIEVTWEARLGETDIAGGAAAVTVKPGATARVPITIPLPAIDRPAGLTLRVVARGESSPSVDRTWPFTVYDADVAARMIDLFGRARVAVYDPSGSARTALRSLGLAFDQVVSFEGLAVHRGNLIVIGPGGFGRGAENLGPILGARARSGARILILEQPELPATLSEDLRLWPAFSAGLESEVMLDASHPIVAGIAAGDAEAFFAPGGEARPLVPPSRGNFHVVAGVRARSGAAWREGIALLEMPVGAGTAIVAQAPLAAAYAREPLARVLLANTLAYLLAAPAAPAKVALYGHGEQDLPVCLARLKPILPTTAADLAGVDVLVAPGDWPAYRLQADAALPPKAAVARFLSDGGTVLLLNPQPLVIDYLQGLSGAAVSFARAAARPIPDPAGVPLLRGVALTDLALLARPGTDDFRLRAAVGRAEVVALLLTPGLSVYRVGRGSLVALTLPEGDACASPRTASLLSRLLTNLGIPLDRSPGADPETVSQLGD